MTEIRHSQGGSQERSLAHRIDMICDAFEQALGREEQPKIEDILREVNADEAPALLRELLVTEWDYRRGRNENVTLQPYLERFPNFTDVVHDAFRKPAASTENDSTIAWIHDFLAVKGIGSEHLSCRILSAVPADVLAQCVTEQEFAAGELLMRQGEPGDSLMIIGDGMVDVSMVDRCGETVVIGHAVRGEVLGEMSLLTEHPRTADVVAVSHVRVLVMTSDTFHELARQFPELTVIITNLIADRLGKSGRDALADKMLDRYRIRRRLGRGGMGIVYEAEDTANDQRVAVKMLSHRLVYNAEALQRFRQELDIVETFDHENIVKPFRRFAAFHTYFIAMEFCEGQTLQETLAREGPLTSEFFHDILGQLASALVYAHRENVLHRDVKPVNIMVTGDRIVKLMDFGLAEPVSGSHHPSRVCGTPRFMAPEQRTGEYVGKESDYFALGCVAYEMLTAEPLFKQDNRSELARNFSHWQPPQFAEIRPDLPAESCRLLQPSLEKNYRQRQLDLERIANWSSR